MALFTSKTNKKEAKPAKAVVKKAPTETAVAGSSNALTHVLQAPRITEKATDAQMKGVYVFNVASDATKRDIITAVKKSYGVSARKVRIVNTSPRSVRNARTGRYGHVSGGKKAYVYLKNGETITIA